MAAREFPTPVVLAVAFNRPKLAGEDKQEDIAKLINFTLGEGYLDTQGIQAVWPICSQELFKQLGACLVEANWELEEREDPRCYILRMNGFLGETIEIKPIGESDSQTLL